MAAAAKLKPIWAYAEDLCCSAAYQVAACCNYIYANQTAMVGSIGTLVLLVDDTAMQEQIGIKYQVVSTGEYKGLGADGSVSDKLISDVQREVNELNAPFLATVTAGRGKKIPDISAVADGRVHVAAQAISLGLIDEIASFDAAMGAVTAKANGQRQQSNAYGQQMQNHDGGAAMALARARKNRGLHLQPEAPATPNSPVNVTTAKQNVTGQQSQICNGTVASAIARAQKIRGLKPVADSNQTAVDDAVPLTGAAKAQKLREIAARGRIAD